MRSSIRGFFAVIGPALIAISLCGSTWRPSIQTSRSAAAQALFEEGLRLSKAGEFSRASLKFQSAALQGERDHSPHSAAMNWSNAGGAELAHLNFRAALPFFLKARAIAASSGLDTPFLAAMNNLASLYLEMGDPESAMRVATEALAAPRHSNQDDAADARLGAPDKLRYQLATALARQHRFDEAEPIYRQSIDGIAQLGSPEETARVLGNFGSDCLDANHLDEAESVLSDALRIVRLHRLSGASNILRPLAKLKARQGDMRAAAALFDAAVADPPGLTTRWDIYTDRGEFRLSRGDLRGALEDLREARRIATRMRADIVPADRDRVTLEGSLSRITTGLVDAGNRLALQESDSTLLRETFDAAEQDRIWSLRALMPDANDWRAHLPSQYWDLLAGYQSLQRTLLNAGSPELQHQADALEAELQHMEAAAAEQSHAPLAENGESALTHARRSLDAHTVLFSFHLTKSSGWLWAVDRGRIAIYSIPGADTLKPAIADFSRALETGQSNIQVLGSDLYRALFGRVAPRYLSHERWLLELEGPLYDLPFAALALRPHESAWLVDRAALEVIPGALLLQPRTPLEDGPFLGIGDPIYNTADSRFQGERTGHPVLLPRLTETAAELDACSLAWHRNGSRLLMGADATLPSFRAALRANPSVIHFATHILSDPATNSSGLIALSLNHSGAMDLIGPTEVVAHPICPGLVVLNGCHSARAQALPGTGLMGLTRAWIGAGARNVVATRWDVPDETGAKIMVDFYQALKADPERDPVFALQQAQKAMLHSSFPIERAPAVWAAYFVLGRE